APKKSKPTGGIEQVRSKNLSTNRVLQSFLEIAENFPAWMHTDEWQSYGPHQRKCRDRDVTPYPGGFCR
ncbi:MAG TPA: hypothetical protein VMQ76_01910, partial [Terracidiphilus sp.]|nr:hypothetical protein [Terracidiphilus sp.]